MPPPAYTRRLVAGTMDDATPLVSAVVPAGVEWVVLQTILTPSGPSGGNVLAFVPGPLYLFARSFSGINSDLTINTHQVVEPGETLTLQPFSSGITFFVLVTGWVLSLT